LAIVGLKPRMKICKRDRHKLVDASKQMILRNALIEPKLIEQTPLLVPPPHHRRLQARNPQNQRNHCSATFSSLFDSIDPLRKSSTRAATQQPKSYSVYQSQQRMERIAIERVRAAWKCSTENRPCGGEAQVLSSAGRPLSKFFAIAPITTKQFGSIQLSNECGKSFGMPQCLSSNPRCIMSPS